MAQFDIQGLNELAQQLDKLGRIDKIAPMMLKEAAPILEEEVVAQSSKHWVSGDMTNSIKPTGAIAGKNGGYYICVRPTGTDQKGVRNMEKAAYLEFGVRGRPATPIITTAVLNAEPAVLQKLQEVFIREMGQ